MEWGGLQEQSAGSPFSVSLTLGLPVCAFLDLAMEEGRQTLLSPAAAAAGSCWEKNQ